MSINSLITQIGIVIFMMSYGVYIFTPLSALLFIAAISFGYVRHKSKSSVFYNDDNDDDDDLLTGEVQSFSGSKSKQLQEYA